MHSNSFLFLKNDLIKQGGCIKSVLENGDSKLDIDIHGVWLISKAVEYPILLTAVNTPIVTRKISKNNFIEIQLKTSRNNLILDIKLKRNKPRAF